MPKVEPVPCPRCGGRVQIYASYGGRGCGDLTTYAAECDGCGMRQDHFGENGRKDSATREYNRWAAAGKARTAGLPPPPKRAVKSTAMQVVPQQHSVGNAGQQREAFESAVKGERDPASWDLMLKRDGAGEYLNDWTWAAWWGWQKASAQKTS